MSNFRGHLAVCRRSLLVALIALLYGALPARATETPAGADPGVPAQVALLLPTGSDAFARPAQAVRAGFSDASRKAAAVPVSVRLYSVSDDPQSVIAAYRQAVAEGARIVVGPLTRAAVSTLAANADAISVPTLALNVPDSSAAHPSNMYTLSLSVEAEARQIAQLALREGRSKAVTFSDRTAIGLRMREAFVEEFQRGGGQHIADHTVIATDAELERGGQAIARSDMAFLAIDSSRLRGLRTQVLSVALYGTSHVNPGLDASTSGVDVPDMRFVDMPWMLQPEHPAVAVYARADARQPDDIERLYALGIDAFRVAQELLAGRRDFDIDGVTGRLTLGADGHVNRALLVALITGGHLAILGEARP